MKLGEPLNPAQQLGDRISRAGVLANPENRLEAMGRVAMEYAAEHVAKWHPIETAPKDWCLVFDPFLYPPIFIGVRMPDNSFWNVFTHDTVQPTHWMPLPEPPK